MTEYMTMAEVVRRLKSIPRHKITYALQSLPEPARISGRRMFTLDDIRLIAAYFEEKEVANGPAN
jgi:hypothetical protein